MITTVLSGFKVDESVCHLYYKLFGAETVLIYLIPGQTHFQSLTNKNNFRTLFFSIFSH